MSTELAPTPTEPDTWPQLEAPRGEKRSRARLAGTKPPNRETDYGFPGFTPPEAERGRKVAKCLRRAGLGKKFAAIKAKDLLILERIIQACRGFEPEELRRKGRDLVAAMDRRDAIIRYAGLDVGDRPVKTRRQVAAERAERASGVV